MRLMSPVLVLLQAGLAAGLVLTISLEQMEFPAVVIAAAGMALHVWAILVMRLPHLSILPEVRPGSRLVTAPPYRWIRHPMYSALALFTLGCLLTDRNWPRLVAWLLLLAVLHIKARREEQFLLKEFPGYAGYQQRTRRFIPFLY